MAVRAETRRAARRAVKWLDDVRKPFDGRGER